MARRAQGLVRVTAAERLIIRTLFKTLPAAAASYQQCLLDLNDSRRKSYRGAAHELREVLAQTLRYLAPDADVMAEAGFQLEVGQERPTQRQRALHILKKRKLSAEERIAPQLGVTLAEELAAQIARDAYQRGSKSAHTETSRAAVRQLKMYVDAVLGELLAIHK